MEPQPVTSGTSGKSDALKSLFSLPDEELMREFQNGNEPAFVLLMRKYKEPIINFLYRFLGNYDDAVDLGQETFVRVFRYGDTYIPGVRFSTWLFTIAANLAKSELRKFWRKNSVPMSTLGGHHDEEESSEYPLPDTSYMPDTRVDQTEISQRVQKALMHVSPTYREVVVLRDIEQLSYEEIAEVTGLEIGTVKSRINRGRKQIQAELKDLYNELFPEKEQ